MPDSHIQQLGEFGLINHLSQRLRQRAGVLQGIGDDAALLQSLQAPVVTCDSLVEDVHFRRDWTTPRALGRKSIAVNVSDIAAMGATPVAAFITLALSEQDDLGFIEELYRGFEDAAAHYNLTIAGGDTSRSLSGLMLSVTVVGDVSHSPILRSGAQVGDAVVVTGSLGDSAAGLALLQSTPAAIAALSENERDYLLSRHHEPMARLSEMNATLALASGETLPVTAGMDISDGLAGDAAHIAQRSDLTLEIDVSALPISTAAREAARLLNVDVYEWALRGGEDYELLWCVSPDSVNAVTQAVQQARSTLVTVIGRCTQKENAPIMLVYPDGRRVAASGAFTHF